MGFAIGGALVWVYALAMCSAVACVFVTMVVKRTAVATASAAVAVGLVLAMVAIMFGAMVFVQVAPPGALWRFLVIELPVLAASYAFFVLALPGVGVGGWFAVVAWNLLWFALFQYSGVYEAAVRVIGGEPAAAGTGVVGTLMALTLGALAASQAVGAVGVRSGVRPKALVLYATVPMAPLTACLVWLRGVPFPKALLVASVDAAVRGGVFAAMQASGTVDRVLGWVLRRGERRVCE